MKSEEVERVKLEDGVRLHESVKVELETYARQTGQPIVKPFVLVIARDTNHAGQLLATIQDDKFFEGRYKDRVIQVDSSQTGAKEDEMIQRLLKVESTDEPTEIVIHVNMLKEGWDVTNLYTIVPLRAANARILIEQSIGRGLRLPYGKRTGVAAVDRLNIVAQDKFQEIVDDARRLDSPLQLEFLVLDPDELDRKTVTVLSKPGIAEKLGLGTPTPAAVNEQTASSVTPTKPIFASEAEQKIAQVTYDVIQEMQTKPSEVPTVAHLQNKDVQAKVLAAVKERIVPVQQSIPGMEIDVADVVAKTTEQVVLGTIDVPRIVVVPKGEVKSGYQPFKLNVSTLRYPVPSEDLWLQSLRTGEREVISLGRGGIEEQRLEDYVVGGLVDFDDVSYDDHADLLYDLATQTVNHFRTALKYGGDDVRKVLRVHQKAIAEFVHVQMLEHYWEETTGYEAVVSRGFTELKQSAFHGLCEGHDTRLPLSARGQGQDRSVRLLRLRTLPLPTPEVPVRHRAEDGDQ
jgi:type III restriction enzyme